MRSRVLATVASLLVLAGCAVTPSTPTPPATPSGSVAPSAAPSASVPAPEVYVEVVASGLQDPWDIAPLPDGRALVTERGGRIVLLSSLAPGASVARVHADLTDVDAPGGGALLGIAPAPDFASSRIFVTCQTHAEVGELVDLRLVRWQLSADGTRADRVQELLPGLPLGEGRPTGCRPALTPDGALVVGAGDTVYRLNPLNGDPWPGNPDAAGADLDRYRYTSGHATVDGVAVQPGTGTLFAVDRALDAEDEVIALRPGNDYAADAVPPVWSSGEPPVGPSGASFLTGSAWGAWEGALALGVEGGKQLLVLTLDGDRLTGQVAPEALRGHGALYAARAGDGVLYVTTGTEVLSVAPAAG